MACAADHGGNPAPLVVAQIGSGEQLGGGQNPRERGAHVVGKPRDHQLEGARATIPRGAFWAFRLACRRALARRFNC